MAQMRPAGCADTFGAHSVRIGEFAYCTGDRRIESRPAAMRVELVLRAVQCCPAAATMIRPGGEQIDIFPGKGNFGGFVFDDLLLQGSQRLGGSFHGTSGFYCRESISFYSFFVFPFSFFHKQVLLQERIGKYFQPLVRRRKKYFFRRV